MLTCRDIAEILNSSDVDALPWRRRMGVRMHARICGCPFCQAYAKQVQLFRSMLRTLGKEHDLAEDDTAPPLSPEARDRITSRLRKR